ncbi:MAG TPA: hypothetical protein VN679_00140, partial [Candidatus Acidoferrales bacterium]|nr:hypothetical protein [Candidatus Acidoferrales bacterium]
MNRRDFLATLPLAVAASAIPVVEIVGEALPPEFSAPAVKAARAFAPAANELDFATALQAAEAIRSRKVSSVELTQTMFARIDRY